MATVNITGRVVGVDPKDKPDARSGAVKITGIAGATVVFQGTVKDRPVLIPTQTRDDPSKPDEAGKFAFTITANKGDEITGEVQFLRQLRFSEGGNGGVIRWDLWPGGDAVQRIASFTVDQDRETQAVSDTLYTRFHDPDPAAGQVAGEALTTAKEAGAAARVADVAARAADTKAANAETVARGADAKFDQLKDLLDTRLTVTLADIKATSEKTGLGLSQLSDFPVFNGEGGGGGSFGDGGSGTSARARIRKEARTLMGFEPSVEQPTQYLNGLMSLYKPVDKGGWTYYQKQPRAYAVTSELGGAVGSAQANLMLTHQNFLQMVEAPRRELFAFNVSADPQNVEAYRSLVGDLFMRIGEEFGRKTGPRPLRVRSLFSCLIGDDLNFDLNQPANAGNVKNGLLRLLRNELNIVNSQINGEDEEKNLAAFRLIFTQTTSLWRYWKASAPDFFSDPKDPALLIEPAVPTHTAVTGSYGRLLQDIQEGLTIVAQKVKIFRAYCDSVNFIEGQREGRDITGRYGPLSLEATLDWIWDTVTRAIPDQIQYGGFIGIRTVVGPTLETLFAVLDNTVPQGEMQRSRVKTAFDQLTDSVEILSKTVGVQIPAPPNKLPIP